MRLTVGMLTVGLSAAVLGGCGEQKTERSVTTADGSQLKVEQSTSGDDAKITATSADGKQVSTITAGEGAKWPAQVAAYAPAYPGGVPTASFSGSSGEGAGGMVTFTTGDSPDKVIDFYKTRAAAAGLGDVSTMDINGARVFGASDAKSGRSIGIQTSVDGGKTTAVLTYGTKPG